MNRCLVVDSSQLVRKVARIILTDFGYEVREAENGQQALALCLLQMPDVLLLDWRLSDMAAFDVVRTLRQRGRDANAYIIYCTTEIDAVNLQHAQEVGVSDVLIKPYDRAALQAKFDRFEATLAAAATAAAPRRARREGLRAQLLAALS